MPVEQLSLLLLSNLAHAAPNQAHLQPELLNLRQAFEMEKYCSARDCCLRHGCVDGAVSGIVPCIPIE